MVSCHVVGGDSGGKIRVSAMLVTLEQDVRESPRTRGQSLAGYDLCHCLGAFTALLLYSIHAYYYCRLLGGMWVHFSSQD